MRRRISLLFFALGFVIFLNSQNDQIEWTANYRLVYDDFKGGVLQNTPKDTKATTFSVIEIDLKQKGQEVHAHIRCLFKKNASWMRPDSRTEYALRHEQGHFDISELYARKIRKKLAGTKVKQNGGEKQIMKICKKLISAHLKEQEKYDKATSFSIREKNQAEWTQRIAKELKETEAYKEPKVVMQFK